MGENNKRIRTSMSVDSLVTNSTEMNPNTSYPSPEQQPKRPNNMSIHSMLSSSNVSNVPNVPNVPTDINMTSNEHSKVPIHTPILLDQRVPDVLSTFQQVQNEKYDESTSNLSGLSQLAELSASMSKSIGGSTVHIPPSVQAEKGSADERMSLNTPIATPVIQNLQSTSTPQKVTEPVIEKNINKNLSSIPKSIETGIPRLATPPTTANRRPSPSTNPSNNTINNASNINTIKEQVFIPKESKQYGAPTRQYLNTYVTPVLLNGMRHLSRERPDNPLQVLGQYLIDHANELPNGSITEFLPKKRNPANSQQLYVDEKTISINGSHPQHPPHPQIQPSSQVKDPQPQLPLPSPQPIHPSTQQPQPMEM